MNNATSAVGRKRKKNGFTQISNAMLEDERLSWRAKGILSYMLSRPDNWKIQKTDLYKRATEGRDAMQNALNELKHFGYLHIYQERKENGRFEYIWEYDDVPFTPEMTETPTTEKQQENEESTPISDITEKQQEKTDLTPISRTLESRTLKTRTLENRQRVSSTLNNTGFNNTKNNNKNNIKNKTKKHMLKSSEMEAEFERLWKLYPRKEGKKKAFDSFKKARKDGKISYETIENGLYRYLKHIEDNGTDLQYIMHGSTWFNQEKWQDEYTTSITMKKKAKNPLDLYRMEFGGNQDEFGGNAQIFDYHESRVPTHLQGNAF